MDAPKYSRSRVDKAGKAISSNPQDKNALNLVNDWREQHMRPMDIVFSEIKSLSGDKNIIVAERLKRLPTIVDKVSRQPTMRLSSMQDIAGVRAILPDISDIPQFVRDASALGLGYKPTKPPTDYIAKPKDDGYRGVHVIYGFPNSSLFVELQIRSNLQHVWATAIESMSIYLGQPFKAGGGDPEWRELFALVSSAFAYFEKSSPIKRHEKIGLAGIYQKIESLNTKLQALDTIRAFAGVGQALHRSLVMDKVRKSAYALISLDLEKKKTTVVLVLKDKAEEAMQEYEKMEKRGSRYDQVLVSVSKMSELDKAYPNYFLDLRSFSKMAAVMLTEYRKGMV